MSPARVGRRKSVKPTLSGAGQREGNAWRAVLVNRVNRARRFS